MARSVQWGYRVVIINKNFFDGGLLVFTGGPSFFEIAFEIL